MTLQSVQITGCVDASKLPVYDDIVLRDAVINTSSRFVSRNLPSSRRFLTDTAGSSVSEQSSNRVTANYFRHCRFEDCLRAGPARYTAPRTSPFSLFLHPLQRLVLFLLIFFTSFSFFPPRLACQLLRILDVVTVSDAVSSSPKPCRPALLRVPHSRTHTFSASPFPLSLPCLFSVTSADVESSFRP